MILYHQDIKRMEEVRRYIMENLSEELDRVHLSRIFGISIATLDRHFFYCNRTTLPRFVRTERMRKAQELLRLRKMSIGEVALQVGYKEISHFSNAFTAYFGRSPLTFLKDNTG